MSISLDDLQLLLDIADCGSFSQAAARRGWSQPQVSQRVAVLEESLGSLLFRRHRRGAVATEACHRFLPAARDALAAIQSGRLELQGAPPLPRITLACLPSLSSVTFAPILLALADAPFEIRCSTDHSNAIMERLLSDSAQVGFVLKCPPIAGIQMERIWRSAIVPVVHKKHPLAAAGELGMRDIANYRLAPQFWGDACDELLAMIRQYRTVSSPLHAIQPAVAARELAMEHGFLTFMPEVAVRRDLREGRLRKLQIRDLPLWEWEVMMAWRSGKRKDAPKQQVLDTVRQIASEWT